jgi:hypothetical protein
LKKEVEKKAPTAGKWCCDTMKSILTLPPCPHHDPIDMQCSDAVIVDRGRGVAALTGYHPSAGVRFVIPIKDGGSSFFAIHYCPFCGKKLEPSVVSGTIADPGLTVKT